jgi:hypothetical protein
MGFGSTILAFQKKTIIYETCIFLLSYESFRLNGFYSRTGYILQQA